MVDVGLWECSAEEYHRDNAWWGHSMIERWRTHPLSAYHEFIAGHRVDLDTDALVRGRILHVLVFERDRQDDALVVYPDDMIRNEKHARWQAFLEERRIEWRERISVTSNMPVSWMRTEDPRTYIRQREYDLALAMADAVLRCQVHDTRLGDLFEHGMREKGIRWEEGTSSGVLLCKARPDWWWPEKGIAADLKGIGKPTNNTGLVSLRPDAIERAWRGRGNHRQRAHYQNGLEAIGQPVEHFLHVVGAYGSRPEACCVVLGPSTMAAAKEQRERDYEAIAAAIAAGEDAWRSDGGVIEVEFPFYVLEER